MKQLKYVIGFLISAVALWYALKDTDFAKVGKAFAEANYWWLAASMLPFAIVMLQKAYRHKTLFWPLKNIAFHNIFAALMMSYLFNTILPARLGEVVRAYTITRRQKIPVGRTFSTVLLEKILDVITLFAFFLVLLALHAVHFEPGLRNSLLIICGIVVAGFVVALLMAWQRPVAERVIRFFVGFLPARFNDRLHRLADQVLDSLEVLIHPRLSAWIWLQSIGIWAVTSISYLFWGYAMNLPPTFSIGLAFLVMITTNLAMAVPSAPGYVGVLELVTLQTLLPYLGESNRELINSYAFLTHIAGFLPLVAVGAVYALREGVSLGEAQREQDQIGSEAGDGEPTQHTPEPSKAAPKPGIVTASADGSTDSFVPVAKPRTDATR